MQLLLNNIRQLVTVANDGKPLKSGPAMRDLGVVENASVLIEDGRIQWIGATGDFSRTLNADADVLDCSPYVALPGFVDSHTHALFGGSRENEFALRAEGKTYQEIAAQGGGIASCSGNSHRNKKRAEKDDKPPSRYNDEAWNNDRRDQVRVWTQ